jgi:beta-1,4-mannosyl-glycoprotein beta-1,4-N-acetylglucosaminyltransferase
VPKKSAKSMKNLLSSVKFWKISSFSRLPGLICLQLTLIVVFVLFGLFISNSIELNDTWNDGNIKFIKNSAEKLTDEKNPTQNFYSTPTFMKIKKNDDFKSIYHMSHRTISISSKESFKTPQICFNEGTESTSNRASPVQVTNKTENEEDFDSQSSCLCKPGWHGGSCSEPEIIWRAFITSRLPMNQAPTFTRNPHNVFHIISNITFISLETLEIQILELYEVVNVFVLCDLTVFEDPSLLIRHQLRKGFLQKYLDRILLIKDSTCSRASIYRHMKKIFGSQLRPMDVLIFGNNDEILNRKAVNYLKWHNHWPQPLIFRMRWNVFGFFWIHPDNTISSTVACQTNILEQVYKSNPDNILKKSSDHLKVGDLNHFGGWFCEYCYQPIDIIKKFHLDSKLNKSSISLLSKNYHRKPTINIEFVENLIHQGIWIDGKTQLKKIRPYDDTKYFVPESVAKNRWKFENLVTNFYASWDDPDNDGYW